MYFNLDQLVPYVVSRNSTPIHQQFRPELYQSIRERENFTTLPNRKYFPHHPSAKTPHHHSGLRHPQKPRKLVGFASFMNPPPPHTFVFTPHRGCEEARSAFFGFSERLLGWASIFRRGGVFPHTHGILGGIFTAQTWSFRRFPVSSAIEKSSLKWFMLNYLINTVLIEKGEGSGLTAN